MDREAVALFVCKVEPCQNKTKHPWEECIYCHPRENARRRDVRKHRYVAEPCPDYANKEFCDLGEDCPFAHGTFEINLHPSKYCTKACTKFPHCDRKICFFAHGEEQLRIPDYSYGYPSVAEAEAVRQQLLAIKASETRARLARTAAFGTPQLQGITPLQMPSPLRSPPVAHAHATSIAEGFRGSLPSSLPASMPSSLPSALPSLLSSSDCLSQLGSLTPLASQGARDFRNELLYSNSTCSSDRTYPMDSLLGLEEIPLGDCSSLHSICSDSASPMLLSPSLQSASLPLEGTGPRMSMKKARELGLQPPTKTRTGSLPGSPNKHALSGHRGHKQHSPVSRFSPGGSSAPRSHWKSHSTIVISPQGRRMPLEEAVTLVSYLSDRDGHSQGVNLANMATALSALYALGYTIAEDDHSNIVEDDRASDKSSPDILRRHMYQGGFENLHYNNGGHFQSMPPPVMHPAPPVTPYAAMLAGIGLNLTAEGLLDRN